MPEQAHVHHATTHAAVAQGGFAARLVALVAAVTAVLVLTAGAARGEETEAAKEARVQSKTVLSPVYEVDKIYPSMKGPQSQQKIFLGDENEPELVWITGYKAVMVGPDGETAKPQQFMCHSNLDIDVTRHRANVGASHAFNPRLFTLSQGQFEVDFPPGFGIPMVTSEPLSLTTQVLNLNLEEADEEVRHKVTVKYVREEETTDEMVPLFPVGAYGLQLLEGDQGFFGVANPDEEIVGPGCLPGENAAGHTYKDNLGRVFTGHWVVKPGREENRTLVTRLLNLPYDTTVHYIAVHLHPFAESLELRDLTTGETLFKSTARNYEDMIGLAHVDYFTSIEGVPLYRDHEYEMVSVYNNTTEKDQDSMAVMYLYLRDKIFDKSKVKLDKPAAKTMEEPEGRPVKSIGGMSKEG